MKSIFSVILVFICFTIIAGCTVVEEPVNLSSMPVGPQQKNNAASQTQAQSQQSLQSSIDAALVWSEKYEKLLTETEELKKSNQQINSDNAKLKEEAAAKDSQIAQLKKELDEANQVLVSMKIELNQWKKDILGFREEMKQSQQALLAASARILRELGAEVRQTPTENVAAADNTK